MIKIICPYHLERTPSCVLYPNGYHCYSCGARGPLSNLPAKYSSLQIKEVEPENLEAAFEYIEALPKRHVRGLDLHSDGSGFYIVWPDRSYYKKRLYQGKCKYMGAAGHEKPPFIANQVGSQTLLLVEGELNALSFAVAVPELDVISPGGTGSFSRQQLRRHLTLYSNYSIIIVVVDEDAAGAKAVMESLPSLRRLGGRVWTWLMPEDANSLLENVGREKLREKVLSVLEEKMGESHD